MGKKRKAAATAPVASPETAAKLPSSAKKKLLKLSQKLQKPGLQAEERLRLLAKLDKKLSKTAEATQPHAGGKVAIGVPSTPKVQAAKSRDGISGRAAVTANTPEERARRSQRMARFQQCLQEEASPKEAVTLQAARSEGAGAVLGRSTALEKEYLRLTSMPTLDAVRPPGVLKRALSMVQQHWLEAADYSYACEQLKSIRQDLTVQLIRTGLTVQVYETHGRIALEQGDLAEFNQCLAALKQLYTKGVQGNEMEFWAYGLLYAANTSPKQLAMELRGVPQRAWQHPYLQHALQVCLAARQADAGQLLDLYESAPRMAPYMMDKLLERLRGRVVGSLSAFQPALPLTFAAALLGFDAPDEVSACLEEHGGRLDRDAGLLLTKDRK